ncbi:DUF2066 domain-containing protein [Zestomonas carbonaria]|uniref:DUF2066 domain-containing protein n=1 Tax=Zestomonas carbonaria TaxID=2762745 RepID=A0A7U7EQ92_9GAMM|nr:DUF2066 domain-containing protein [Pseudomonas carbonaria]CAD5108682.1 hypothetical protein PSEWESI4_02974 [Pseudomonas carbonaria]
MRVLARLFVLCLALFSVPSFAAMVADLYQVREPVASQTPEERDAALGRAFETLVQRLTGDAKAARSQALAAVRQDPQQVVSQYGYEGQDLVVDFDPVSTERSLRQAGLPLWGANRPAILAWWLNSSSEGSNLVGDAQPSAEPLQRAAQHRGLPLRLPLADLSEQLVGTAENISAGQPDALQEASERYDADALLAVDAREEDGQWQAQWRLWLGDSREQGTAKGSDANSLADAVMLAVGERLAPRFAAAPGSSSGSLTLEVQGADLARYAELNRLLEPFGARLRLVEGDRLTYQVSASAEQLRAQLSLAHLQEVPAPQAAAPEEAAEPVEGVPQEQAPRVVPRGDTLYFRW